MIKLIALYKQPGDIEAFEQHYTHVHLRLIEKIPGIRKTEWTRITASPGGAAPYYMMFEMYFDNMDAYKAAMRSEENKAAGADLMSFAKDIVTLMVAESYEDEVRPMGNGSQA